MGYLFCVLWCGFAVQVYCHARGFMASFHAGFDHSRAARQVLHDFVDGKLLYCHAPPSQPTLTQFSFPADPEEPAPGPEAVEGGVAAAPGTFYSSPAQLYRTHIPPPSPQSSVPTCVLLVLVAHWQVPARRSST